MAWGSMEVSFRSLCSRKFTGGTWFTKVGLRFAG